MAHLFYPARCNVSNNTKTPLVQGRKGLHSWYHPGSATDVAALGCPPTRAFALTGEPGETCPAVPVQPLGSQATFGGRRCEGLQPGTLFSRRCCERLPGPSPLTPPGSLPLRVNYITGSNGCQCGFDCSNSQARASRPSRRVIELQVRATYQHQLWICGERSG